MAIMSAGNIPANYAEFASDVTQPLLLPQPEPQYLLAQFAMASRLSLAALDAGADTAQQLVAGMNEAGQSISPGLDRLVRAADMYPGFFQAMDEFGVGKGDTIKFQRPIYATGGLTKAARELNTNETISTTGTTPQSEEVTVVLKEYHGPDRDGNGVKPYAIWDFDDKYKNSKVRLTSLATRHLVHDYTKWLNTVLHLDMSSSQYTTLTNPDYSDVSEFVDGGAQGFSMEAILRARKALTDREWMPFANGRYTCLVPTSFNIDMAADLEYQKASQYFQDGRNLIFGYIGSLQDIDFFECSTLVSYAAAATVAGDAAGTVGSGVTLQEAILCGPGTLGVGTAPAKPSGSDSLLMGPVARFADNTNYGTTTNVIWYALHALDMIDQRGIQRIIAQSDHIGS